MEITMTNHEDKAKTLFINGYNCAQAVFAAFGDLTGIDNDLAVAISSSFGGGMGRMREVCGAVSGMFMAAGVLYGGDSLTADGKAEHYARIRELADAFRAENGTIICRELLGLPKGESGGDPAPRTKEYYKKRPCAEMVASAARILDKYIENNPIEVIES